MGSTLSSKQLYFRLLGYVRPHWRVFAAALFATACMAATEPLFPALMKPLLDEGFGKDAGQALYWMPAAIILIFVARGAFSFFSSYCFSWVSNRVITDLRRDMFDRLVRLPNDYYLAHPSSEPLTRISHDVNGVASAATSVLTTLMRSGLTIVGLLVWLFYLNWQLTLISLAMGPVVAVVIRAFSGRLRRMSLAAQEGVAELNRVLQENIHCQKVVKVYGGEEREAARFGRVNNALRGYGMRQAVAAAASAPLVQMCTAVALAVVVYVALSQAAREAATVGSFVSFITAMLLLLPSLRNIADVNAPLQRGLAAAESVFKLIDEKPEESAGSVSLPRAEGRLSFESLTFTYPGAESPALDQISIDIRAGEVVALVGPSGGGKSTLVSLIPRFFSPQQGALRLDGHDIKDLSLPDLRRNVALVTQETLLFDDSVAGNIAYGVPNASREDVEAAARAAHALGFIQALPEGFDTKIGEHGTRLSGGQRQRIAIARALLKDAPVLILDEATSALDNESERAVQAALEELMKGRTTLVIAHRLSTIEQADRIVVLSKGCIAEMGSHADLLARNGVYAQLHRLQFAEGQA